MSREWIHEPTPRWDADKQRIVGDAPAGIFQGFDEYDEGDLVPGEWWRVEYDGETVGFGWMDITWGDGEILLAVDPDHHGYGVGEFILDHLEREAARQGLNVIYNTVRATHPNKEWITNWLQDQGFERADDESLRRRVRKG